MPDEKGTFLLNDEHESHDVAKKVAAGTLTLAGILIAAVLTIGGNAITIITINFWLNTFPANVSSQLAILVVSNALYFVGFVILLIAVTIRYGWRKTWTAFAGYTDRRLGGCKFPLKRIALLAAVGATDVGSNFLSLYATTPTPEVLQALLQCSIPFFTLIQTVLFIPSERKRNYKSIPLILSFLFLGAGIIVASWQTIFGGGSLGKNSQAGWITVYIVSCVVYGTWTVLQRVYLDTVTAEDDAHQQQLQGEEVSDEVSIATMTSSPTTAGTSRVVDVDESVVAIGKANEIPPVVHKLVMLVGDTGFQLLFTFALLPTDAIQGFGNSASVSDTWTNFTQGVRCIFNCKDSLSYGILYAIGYIVTYGGEAQLNHFSPTLSSIVLQLSSPITAIILLIIPSWNVDAGGGSWHWQVGGLALLLVATALYNFWENTTRRAGAESEAMTDEDGNAM